MSLTRGRELLIGARAGLLDPKHVRAMGSARWLYDWILWRVTSEQDGLGLVLGGSPVRCEEIAADLGVGLRTIYRWMNRLRGSYIRTRHVVRYGRHGLTIEVLRSKKFRAGRTRGISTISTVSTENPARTGRHNPAGSGRNNPARDGGSHKEYRKPFTESYGKVNYGFLEDLPVGAKPRKANPPFPPVVEGQDQNQKQIPSAYAKAAADRRCARNDSALLCHSEGIRSGMPEESQRDASAWLCQGHQNPGEIPRRCAPRNDSKERCHPGEVPSAYAKAAADRRCAPRNDSSEVRAAPASAETSADGPDCANVPEREVLAELRLLVRARAMPGEDAPGRREMLERQRNELLERAARRCLPP